MKTQIMIFIICVGIAFLLTWYADEHLLGGQAFALPLASNQSITTRIILDNSSIPIVNYGDNVGLQRNPLTVANFALTDYSSYKKYGNDIFRKAFLSNTNWLLKNSVSHGNQTILQHRLPYPPFLLVNRTVSHGNYSILEYEFPYPLFHLSSPWRSAMAQGEALPVLIKAYEITGNGKYIELARTILNSFYVEVKDGGLTYKTPNDGWWYEEYAGNRTTGTGILSGMMYTVLAIHDYYNLTKDPAAKYLFDKGVLALTKNLSRYDYKNGTSSYDDLLGHLATPDRLKSNVSLLGQLYDLTKQQVLKFYQNRWENSINKVQSLNNAQIR